MWRILPIGQPDVERTADWSVARACEWRVRVRACVPVEMGMLYGALRSRLSGRGARDAADRKKKASEEKFVSKK